MQFLRTGPQQRHTVAEWLLLEIQETFIRVGVGVPIFALTATGILFLSRLCPQISDAFQIGLIICLMDIVFAVAIVSIESAKFLLRPGGKV